MPILTFFRHDCGTFLFPLLARVKPLLDERRQVTVFPTPSGKDTAMLVLSRRLNEKVVFPDFHTAVQVLSVKGGKVRLGIEAPPAVTVLREELQAAGQIAERMPPQDLSVQTKMRQLNHLLPTRLNVAAIRLSLLSPQFPP